MKKIIVAVFVAFALVAPAPAHAEAVYAAEADGAILVLHKEKCTLPAVVNLPFRAEWVEGEKVIEGCWSPPHPEVGVVMTYFADKTVIAIPVQLFERVTPI